MKSVKDYSVIILAAGKSERLGFPKLSLKYNGNTTFIEQIANVYNVFGCKEIIIIVNEIVKKYIIDNNLKFPANTKIIVNEHPDWHRYYSLKLGAKQVKENHSVFIHNVDNPFVNLEVIEELVINADKAEYVSPEYEGKGGHPFLISSKVIQDLKASETNQMHLKEFLNQYSRQRVPVSDEKVLANINNLEEYRKFFSSEL